MQKIQDAGSLGEFRKKVVRLFCGVRKSEGKRRFKIIEKLKGTCIPLSKLDLYIR